MKLYLMRHGVATPAQHNVQRPLTKLGVDGVHSVANLFVSANLRVDRIVHSEIRRAVETAKIMEHVLGTKSKSESWKGLRPSDPIDRALDNIQTHTLEHPQDNLLVIGHLPFLYDLLHALAGTAQTPSVQFGEAYVACLSSQEKGGWSMDQNDYACHITPLLVTRQ